MKRFVGHMLLPVSLWVAACGCSDPKPQAHETVTFHKDVKLGADANPIIEACGGLKCPLKDNQVFNEVEYLTDSAAKVQGVAFRTMAPDPPNVSKSQEIFERTRILMISAFGKGEAFVKTGDPTYWPGRHVEERVVTLTIDESQRTVLSIGAVGPDAEKIPRNGRAHDQKEVAKYLAKLMKLDALKPKKKK